MAGIPAECVHSQRSSAVPRTAAPAAAVLVVPLLRCHFFCTESEAYRQQVFYYRWVGAAPVCWCNVLMCRCVGAGQRMCTACVPEGAVCGACLEQM